MPRIYEDRGIDLENTVNYSVFGLKLLLNKKVHFNLCEIL